MPLTVAGEPLAPRPPAGFALFALGFRPFYLLAGVFAALSVLGWAAQFEGVLPSDAYVNGALWHAHEMLFGYAFAVITGFLFTAVRNWADHPTPTGPALAAAAALWVAARALVLSPWPSIAAAADALFAIAVALGIGQPLLASGNRRNYFFIALVLGLGAANLAFHAALAGWLRFDARWALGIGLDLVLFIMAVVAGRVVPSFTNNAIPGADARRNPVIERAALGLTLALLVCDVAGLAAAAAVVAFAAALAHGARVALWAPMRVLRNPLLWILHLSYAWIAVHLALRGAAGFGWIAPNLATHALSIGAIGGLTLGMMTRTSRGHTARPLRAGRIEIACYVLVNLAAVARVFLPLVAPGAYRYSISVSAALWSTAFALFTIAYWPILTRPRLDGLPG
ncbi:MAG: NnrS family protein [Betaproteobacteria bacterium]|nr:NnrS family protein [Betaproteobacteria bacterium]